MELRRYLAILRRRLWLIIVTMIVAASVAWASTPRTPTFTATATIYVGSRQFLINPETTAFASDRLQAATLLLFTFSRMIDSRVIAQSALDHTGIARTAPQLVAATDAEPEPNTQLLAVRVTDRDPVVAQRLANGLADAFTDSVRNFEPAAKTTEGAVPALPAYVFERAAFPTVPNPTGLAHDMLLATLFGLVASVAVAFLLEYLDVSIKGVADAERQLDLPVLGVIPVVENPAAPWLRPVPAGDQRGRRRSA